MKWLWRRPKRGIFRSAWRAHLMNGCRIDCWYCKMQKKMGA